MMKEWHFNVLFCVGVGGAVFLLLAPTFGIDMATNPTALAGVGTILTYVLTQKKTLTRGDDKPETKDVDDRGDSEEVTDGSR